MDGMSATEEDSVFEPEVEEEEEEEEEEEDGETYFRTEHVSRTEELQEEVDMAAKVRKSGCTKFGSKAILCRKFPCSVSFLV